MKRKATTSDLLSEREQAIVKRLATGLSNQQIADELFLSVYTVKWYNCQIYSKLGVRNRTQAVASLRGLGLLDSDQEMSPIPLEQHPSVSPLSASPASAPSVEHLSESGAGLESRSDEPALVRPEGESTQEEISSTGSLWNVPYRRNPCFTGREEIFHLLRDRFVGGGAVALTQPQALSGLGGIGKTQVAVEYAYRYRTSYQAVFWVRAASEETLIADFASIATQLSLSGQDAADQATAVAAARRWLSQQRDWLLILDNADDLAQVALFFPEEVRGHLLLTTRSQATGPLAFSCCVEPLDQQDSCLLLLRRANLLAQSGCIDQFPSAQLELAQMLVEELGGLPLALEQAGAYLEETGSSLSEYLALFQRHQWQMLAWRSSLSLEYPRSVASTWQLSFQQIEQASPVAADLLRLCAFLSPDAIAEALLGEGASALPPALSLVVSDPLRFHETIGVLRRYSFLRRDGEVRTLSIHRLVQAVLRESLGEDGRREWAERTVRMVAAAFPEAEELANWPRWQQYLPHALTCATFIEEHQFAFSEAAGLLHRTGRYVRERGFYTRAQALLQQALRLHEQVEGGEHSHTSAVRNDLGYLYSLLGKYAEAEPLCLRALTVQEQTLAPLHPDIAMTLYRLAYLYRLQGKYAEAEPLYLRALTIREQVFGSKHTSVADVLIDLGYLSTRQGKYQEAEVLYQRALAINEQALDPSHPDLAVTLNEAAYLYTLQRKYTEAEALYRRALAIWEQHLGLEHPHTATCLSSLSHLYYAQGKYEEAEPLMHRTFAIYTHQLGTKHPHTITCLHNLGRLYCAQRRYEEAEPLLQRALVIREQQLGEAHPDVATSLNSLANFYSVQGRYTEAEPLFQRALHIREQTFGTQHSATATTLDLLGQLYQAQERYEQAEAHTARALSIREQILGLEHPETVALRMRYNDLQERRRQ